MKRVHSGSAVPRHLVFVLADGTYVIQWSEARVQDLLTGRYLEYNQARFGHLITDYELERLQEAGIVEHFSRQFVWIYALPEGARFGLRVQERSLNRVRTYYLNTTLPAFLLDQVTGFLEQNQLATAYRAVVRDDLVIILGREAAPFPSLKDAEAAQRQLQMGDAPLLRDLAVAFTEAAYDGRGLPPTETETLDLEAIIASQTEVSFMEGKFVLLACRDDAERAAMSELLHGMKSVVSAVNTGTSALHVLEECVGVNGPPNVLLMDMQLPDMHGWELLAKAHEIHNAPLAHIVVLADASASERDHVFALTVAGVDAFLVKPVSMARLRQTLWSLFKRHPVSS